MSHHSRRLAVASAVTCVAAIGPAAAAHASDATIRSAIKAAVPKIEKSQAKLIDSLATYKKTHNPTALISAVKAENATLRALETRLSHRSASTTDGAKGKAAIVTGLRLIIGSNTTLAKELQQSARHAPVSKAKLKASIAEDNKGNRDLNAGSKLLKL